jgi:Fe-S cluster assembly protein SufD
VNGVIADRALSAYREDFDAREARGREPAWLRTLRANAFARFTELGIPGRKEEAWRHLDLNPIRNTVFPLADSAGLGAPGGSGLREKVAFWPDSSRLVFVDGVFSPDLSEPPTSESGWQFRTLAAGAFRDAERPAGYGDLARMEAHPFAAWNTAFAADGADLSLRANATAVAPVYLIFVAATPGVHHPRLRVNLGRGARAALLEEYVSLGDGATFANATGEIRLCDGAELEHVRIQREAAESIHYGTVAVEAGRDARYRSTSFALGAGPARVDLGVRLAGPGAECRLHGLYVPDGRRMVDHHTSIDHLVPRTTSHQLYKGILADRSRAVFNGMIHIHEGAQQSVAEQHNPNLVLSPDALVNSNPQLRIHADDVKCRHGSTIGQMDGDKLFYLRSRGLSEPEAAMLLVTAFTSEILEAIGVTEVRETLTAEVARRCVSHV